MLSPAPGHFRAEPAAFSDLLGLHASAGILANAERALSSQPPADEALAQNPEPEPYLEPSQESQTSQGRESAVEERASMGEPAPVQVLEVAQRPRTPPKTQV